MRFRICANREPHLVAADLFVARARLTGARVTFIEDPALLADFGGAGARSSKFVVSLRGGATISTARPTSILKRPCLRERFENPPDYLGAKTIGRALRRLSIDTRW